ncbi:hypothetical protein ACH5RR_003499 [Cinchona calisaya]|uniref:Uncharacterized protein n=1 Tax=Cinchona calisaya TaxID=153742 RepID=A0ABD3AVE3_9GENT
MASKLRQGFSDNNIPADDVPNFNLGNFILNENPTKKVVKQVRRMKKNSAINQPNSGNETVVSSGSGSTIPRPQSIHEPTLSPQMKEEVQLVPRRRKASTFPDQNEVRAFPNIEVLPKVLEPISLEETQTPIILAEY